MSKELVEEATKVAHQNGMKVAAHVESPEGMKVAIEAGIDSIEHGSLFDEKLIPIMKKNNEALVTTLSPAVPFVFLKPEVHGYGEVANINGKIVLDGMIDASKLCLKHDIPVGLGTDAGSTLTSHYNFYKELILFERMVGVDRNFALYTATLGNAKIAGIDKETGSVEVNKSADLLIVNSNPLDDLNTFAKPFMVMMKGRLIKNPKFKRDKVLDKLVDSII